MTENNKKVPTPPAFKHIPAKKTESIIDKYKKNETVKELMSKIQNINIDTNNLLNAQNNKSDKDPIKIKKDSKNKQNITVKSGDGTKIFYGSNSSEITIDAETSKLKAETKLKHLINTPLQPVFFTMKAQKKL